MTNSPTANVPHDQIELFAIDVRREQARALRREGLSVTQISKRLKVASYYRVLSWVADLPPPNNKLRARAKDDVKARARELREQGRTYAEIAAELGVSKSSCALWCSDLPKSAPRPGKRRASTWDRRLAERAAERAARKQRAFADIGNMSSRELFLVGVGSRVLG